MRQNIIFYMKPALLFLVVLQFCSCSNDILEEKPEGFLSPDNAFGSVEGYEAGIAELQRLSRGLRTNDVIRQYAPGIEGDKAVTTIYANGTDLGWFVVVTQNQFTDYTLINPTNPLVQAYWTILYKIVANSNTIIASIKTSTLKKDDKLKIEGNARFFRAFAYRYLIYLYGDVPILKDEITSPEFDFIRDPIKDVLTFMKEDLEFASINLPQTNPGDGGLSKAAADHVLTETLISLGDYDQAIAAASRIIEDPQYRLMQNRFGSVSNNPGDVFWDLFRTNNQNRASGNTEGIWVWQLDFDIANGNPRNQLTRSWGPRLEQLKDSKGISAYVPADTLGRGSSFVKPTYYLDSLIWQSDFDRDIRNSKYNMQRHFINNNPESTEYGQLIVPKPSDLDRNHHVFVTKAASPEGYVQGYDLQGNLYTDFYAIRLSETYLLRAEAYLDKGDKINAAADINVVRNRANATPASSNNIDLDYLLDERARELVVEEPRRLTLARLNKLVERVRLYNPVSSPSIQEFNNLWPIPQSEIDANIKGDLTQNPGY